MPSPARPCASWKSGRSPRLRSWSPTASSSASFRSTTCGARSSSRSDRGMTGISQAVIERARNVRLVLMDADGVLTDGRIIVFADGNDVRFYHARDGLAVRPVPNGGLRIEVHDALDKDGDA